MSRLPRCVQLRRLLGSASFIGCAEISVESATDRADAVRPGDLFVARVGPHADGHDFAAQAVTRGAAAVLCERPLPELDVPQCVVSSTADAFGVICQALHGFPAQRLPIVGVTGTDGKTTTTWLLRAILSQSVGGRPGRPAALSGTIDVDDGRTLRPASLTTPGPMAIAEWVGRAVGNGCGAAVMELSSHALAQNRAAGVSLDAAIVTNLGRDHLDYHNTQRDYEAAKARIVSQVKPGGAVVIGASAADAVLSHVAPTGRQFIICGDHLAATASVEVHEESGEGLRLTLRFGIDAIELSSPLVGRHNAENILYAALAASHLGACRDAIVAGVASLTSVPGRMEAIETFDRTQVFVDYAHTPRAIETVVATARRLAQSSGGRVFAVTGAGGGRDVGKRPLMGAALSAADRIILTSDNPRHEDPLDIAQQIADGVSGGAFVRTVLSRQQAIEDTIAEAREGDVVLVLGKGHEQTQTIGDDVRPFDDRAVCREAAARRTSSIV